MLTIDASAATLFNDVPQTFSAIQSLGFYPANEVLMAISERWGGIKKGTKKVYDDKMSKIMQVADGCNVAVDDGTIELSERSIDPVSLTSLLPICAAALPDNFAPYMSDYQNQWDKLGFQDAPLSDQLKFIIARTDKAIDEATLRRFWYGMATAVASGAATPGLKSADDIKYYTGVSGVVEQINGLTSANKIPHFDPSTFTTVTDMLDAMFNGSMPHLKADANKEIWLDGKSYVKYKNELKALDRTTYQAVANGIKALTFDNIPVYTLENIEYLFDGDLEANSTTHAKWQPTKAILMTKKNFKIATISKPGASDDFTNVQIFYNRNFVNPTTGKRQQVFEAEVRCDMAVYIDSLQKLTVAFGTAPWA